MFNLKKKKKTFSYEFFIRQTCSVSLAEWDRDAIWLNVSQALTVQQLNQNYMPYNSGWKLVGTNIDIELGGIVSVLFHFTFHRNAHHFAINLFAPSLILTVLQLTAFMLPANTSERAMFTITIMLTEFVLKSEMMANLPKTPQPIYLSYYVLGGIVITAIITAYSSTACWLSQAHPHLLRVKKTKWKYSVIELIDKLALITVVLALVILHLATAVSIGLI